jgi:hypothetical protein
MTIKEDHYKGWLDTVLAHWTMDRDRLFRKHGISIENTYAENNFMVLPTEVFRTVCYVDAFSTALTMYEAAIENQVQEQEVIPTKVKQKKVVEKNEV